MKYLSKSFDKASDIYIKINENDLNVSESFNNYKLFLEEKYKSEPNYDSSLKESERKLVDAFDLYLENQSIENIKLMMDSYSEYTSIIHISCDISK